MNNIQRYVKSMVYLMLLLSGTVHLMFLVGCVSSDSAGYAPEIYPPMPKDVSVTELSGIAGIEGDITMPAPPLYGAEPSESKAIVWQASLSLEVKETSQSAQKIAAIVAQKNGSIDNNQGNEKHYWISFRVPSVQLESTLEAISQLGEVKHKDVSSYDAGQQMQDIQAYLDSKIALRTRFQALLKQATKMADILAIEKEINRLQTEIDQLQNQLSRNSDAVAMSTVNVDLARKKILGPLGYVFKGVYWTVRKLFVLRD